MMLAAVDVNVAYPRIESLLGYRGDSLTYRQLHFLTRISTKIEVVIQQGNLQHLMRAIDDGTPPAVFILTGELPYWVENVPHAVVLTGYTETEFSIHDPAFAFAPQIVAKGDLDLAWLEYDSYFAVVQRRR